MPRKILLRPPKPKSSGRRGPQKGHGGRPRRAALCACGEMTAARAESRRHICSMVLPDQIDLIKDIPPTQLFTPVDRLSGERRILRVLRRKSHGIIQDQITKRWFSITRKELGGVLCDAWCMEVDESRGKPI